MVDRTTKIKADRLITISVALILLIVIYFYSERGGNALSFKCIHKSILGFECPLCGSTRATAEILHFNFSAAWHLNPAIFSLIIFFLFETTNLLLNCIYDKYRRYVIWFVIISFLIIYIQRLIFALY